MHRGFAHIALVRVVRLRTLVHYYGIIVHTMRGLQAVLHRSKEDCPDLKRRALLFDRIHILDESSDVAFNDDIEFLRLSGFVCVADRMSARHLALCSSQPYRESLTEIVHRQLPAFHDFSDFRPAAPWTDIQSDFAVRLYSAGLSATEPDSEIVPVCKTGLDDALIAEPAMRKTSAEQVLRVAVDAFPVPDERCAWQDVFDFKADSDDKQWLFRRFLRALATKKQTEPEIRDEIEWMLNEYSNAMRIHRIKASQSFVDVFVISPLEIIENLVKLNLSKIAKGALSIKKRKVELMEAEMKAPGRECGYVFDARKRFGMGSGTI